MTYPLSPIDCLLTSEIHVLNWICYLPVTGRLQNLPSTTFHISVNDNPILPSRSYQKPWKKSLTSLHDSVNPTEIWRFYLQNRFRTLYFLSLHSYMPGLNPKLLVWTNERHFVIKCIISLNSLLLWPCFFSTM